MLAVNQGGIIVEAAGKIWLVKAGHADHLTVCAPRVLSLSPHDRLQLKAKAKAVCSEMLANGKVVTIKECDLLRLAGQNSGSCAPGRCGRPRRHEFAAVVFHHFAGAKGRAYLHAGQSGAARAHHPKR
jgi:hypothetical protein